MQLDPGTDTLMPAILFLHRVLTHFPRCGEPISWIISKDTQSLGISRGGGGGEEEGSGCRPIYGSIAIFSRFLLNLPPDGDDNGLDRQCSLSLNLHLHLSGTSTSTN